MQIQEEKKQSQTCYEKRSFEELAQKPNIMNTDTKTLSYPNHSALIQPSNIKK